MGLNETDIRRIPWTAAQAFVASLLTTARADYRFRWSITGNPDAVVDCQFTASNVPARSEG